MLDSHTIVERLADGRFSEVYLGKCSDRGVERERVFKIAKPAVRVKTDSTDIFQTRALEMTDSTVRVVRPNTNQLLLRQQSVMNRSLSPFFATASRIADAGEHLYFSMDNWGPTNFRTLMNSGQVRISFFDDLISCMVNLSSVESFQHHGDLKPENLLASPDGIKFIDPGFFGEIDCQEGSLLQVAVTTPLYYPFLKPDDLLAVGLMLWEAVCGEHPLCSTADIAGGDRTVDDSVHDWIGSANQSSVVILAPLLALKRPSTICPDMPPLLEQVLLKGLRLQLTSTGSITTAKGYDNWTEWMEDIAALKREESSSIEFLR